MQNNQITHSGQTLTVPAIDGISDTFACKAFQEMLNNYFRINPTSIESYLTSFAETVPKNKEKCSRTKNY
jgi:hypothetical protein